MLWVIWWNTRFSVLLFLLVDIESVPLSGKQFIEFTFIFNEVMFGQFMFLINF